MLGDGLSSPLFRELRDARQLYYSGNVYEEAFVPGISEIRFQCQTNKKKVDDVKNSYWEIVSQTFTDQKRFEFAKDRRLAMFNAYEPTPDGLLYDISESLHMGEWVEIDEWKKITQSFTFEEIIQIAQKYINPNTSFTLSASN